MPDEVSYETNIASNSKENKGLSAPPTSPLKSAIIFQEFRDEIDDLKMQLSYLNNEVLRDRQRIMSLEKGRKAYGENVKKRVESMLLLIIDYGGSMKSSSIKKYMGLSKDELYRTLRCAREEGLIETLPDPKDRRGSLISIIK